VVPNTRPVEQMKDGHSLGAVRIQDWIPSSPIAAGPVVGLPMGWAIAEVGSSAKSKSGSGSQVTDLQLPANQYGLRTVQECGDDTMVRLVCGIPFEKSRAVAGAGRHDIRQQIHQPTAICDAPMIPGTINSQTRQSSQPNEKTGSSTRLAVAVVIINRGRDNRKVGTVNHPRQEPTEGPVNRGRRAPDAGRPLSMR